jgi:hypothetical protein
MITTVTRIPTTSVPGFRVRLRQPSRGTGKRAKIAKQSSDTTRVRYDHLREFIQARIL